jgi:hypothetical protein
VTKAGWVRGKGWAQAALVASETEAGWGAARRGSGGGGVHSKGGVVDSLGRLKVECIGAAQHGHEVAHRLAEGPPLLDAGAEHEVAVNAHDEREEGEQHEDVPG